MIIENFYMDDLLVGANSEEELEELRKAIHEKLKSAGFLLKKYASNSEETIRNLDVSLLHRAGTVAIVDKSAISMLGMSWLVETDQLRIKMNLGDLEEEITKISILSFVSRQYDPLGRHQSLHEEESCFKTCG